jgi:hypothetical protein
MLPDRATTHRWNMLIVEPSDNLDDRRRMGIEVLPPRHGAR